MMSTSENCLILTYLFWLSSRVQMKKDCGDTPSARLRNDFLQKFKIYLKSA